MSEETGRSITECKARELTSVAAYVDTAVAVAEGALEPTTVLIPRGQGGGLPVLLKLGGSSSSGWRRTRLWPADGSVPWQRADGMMGPCARRAGPPPLYRSPARGCWLLS
jgi:hypothetical protein